MIILLKTKKILRLLLEGVYSVVISSIVLELLSYMAEREREKINDRQPGGIAIALNNGGVFGRPKQTIDDEFKGAYEEWK